ncbi:hypothetical protein JOL79_28660 [Microbispora sp. RL4-1S]|uniref:YopA central domain-containing protein n=1 Tax=Microbispora oryzae TaxID=2806554 RepID=A0A940WPV3_9ACTN|nr:hypothetical protein [Microbispora oryzae]MBP2707762.1 hypothetical protein [Microbispora oryzae]
MDLVWRLEGEEPGSLRANLLDIDDLELILRQEGDRSFVAHRRNFREGWLDGLEIGSTEAPIKRIVAHWLNLPALRSPIRINGGSQLEWFTGRWTAALGEWRLTIDRRPDHADVWRALGEAHSIAVTHVMEVRRADERDFTAADAKQVLKALQFALSFALGRWVAPALPVGLDGEDRPVWREWAPYHCSNGRSGALAWWWPQGVDIRDYLNEAIVRFSDPDRRFSTQFLMTSAVLMNFAGFVEQRIMTAFAAIEHLSWITLRAQDGMSKKDYDRLKAVGRLRELLNRANVGCDIDADVLQGLAKFAEDANLDGPAAITRIRNEIVHPKQPQKKLYESKGLVRDAWLLCYHYLTLLLLHHMEYSGSYQKAIKNDRWAGDVESVPWL